MTSQQTSAWGTDGPISMPVPLAADVGDSVSMGGLSFTPLGMAHDLSPVDLEQVYAEAYAPPAGPGG